MASRAANTVVVILALALAALTPPSHATKCAAPPLRLPYANISAVPGTLTQGIAITFGTPGQSLALTPSLQLDSTFIPRWSSACLSNFSASASSNSSDETKRSSAPPPPYDEWLRRDTLGGLPGAALASEQLPTHSLCAAIYGGAYDPDLSSTFRDTGTNDQLNEFWLRRAAFKDWHFIDDTFAFADYASAHMASSSGAVSELGNGNVTARVVLPDSDSVSFGGLGSALLGLGPNSSVLAVGVEGRVVPSASWSLAGGELCLGCVDEEAVTGQFGVFGLADREAEKGLPCVLQVDVEALTWRGKEGDEGVELVDGGFKACVDPGVRFLVLPEGVRKKFEESVGREVENEFEDYIAFKGPAKGDDGILTVKLQGALQVNITIPGAEKAGADEGGTWHVPIGKGGWGAYGNDVWVLGKPFTDHIVLKWDAGVEKYGIANLNEKPGKPKMKPLGCDEFPEVKNGDGGSNVGVIVGSIVGGFVGGLVFALLGLWFFNKGQKGVKRRYQVMPEEDMVPMNLHHQPAYGTRCDRKYAPCPQ
ncbi:hypothetical protein BS50DRAFT_634164 [Corynespora cassiicola Philippines]|uniref:Peptidase A1 domain-containing protein n=1 Tax=Corynespora cassiicola Philippines TaxID=1448308 RepID=A0A2T2NMS2_CORCC|nr:hypothetical protein BS50DRAFT_634164 [Corynespora cassiicola Philippines]